MNPASKSTPIIIIPLLVTVILFYCMRNAAAATFNVLNFGAKADGRTDSAKAFTGAWVHACASAQPASIMVPPGRFLVGSITFSGQCANKAISFEIQGTLVAPSDYNILGKKGNWIVFEHVDGVSIRGGLLDGQGTALWNCKNSGKGSCPSGATTLLFSNSNNIFISGLSSLNSQLFNIVINECQNVMVQGVSVTAAGNSPNTDGIHVQGSSHVTILSSKIRTGDDCISIGPGTTNFIGSLGKELKEAGVQNVTVKTVTFTGTQNGVRIKSWGRPSTGFVRDVIFQDAIMVNAQNPILIDQNYCPDNEGCPGQASGVKISDVTYKNIHGTSATEVAVNFDCSPKNPCSGIKLEDVKLTYKNQVAQASCVHAAGTTLGSVQPENCL
ncbi:Polygalacturonase [Arachis hypogaea]|nr:Polygalacturonase [Arachis hypogaea]